MKDFIEFSMTYYRNRITAYENGTCADLYEAKQLLKMVDDIIDEGYMALYDTLETEQLYTRLRALLERNGVTPFEKPSASNVPMEDDGTQR